MLELFMAGAGVAGTEAFSASSAITGATEVFNSIWTLITGNPMLIIFLGAALVPVGFKIFKAAKGAAKN